MAKKMVKDDKTIAEIFSALRGEARGVIVFGSVTRGDFHIHSDIDVIQLRNRYGKSYKSGRVNVSVYDVETLKNMAAEGSIFVLHLIKEGCILRDEEGFLKSCLSAYKRMSSYEPYRTELRVVANMLDVSMPGYLSRWKSYNELALFILRSVLYADFAERNTPCFSVDEISKQKQSPELLRAFQMKYVTRPDWDCFKIAKILIENYLFTNIHNSHGSLEALITNCDTQTTLVRAFGLRLISKEHIDFSYDIFSERRLGWRT